MCSETLSMLRVSKTRPLPGHSIFESIGARKTSSCRASTHHGVQQVRQCAGHLVNTRHGAYLEYTQNIVLQHQGECYSIRVNPTPLICSTNPTAMFLRLHR
ncbi:hypothetical protein TNCV_3385221 [Trichonephila clavipes]|uniref:Uncharacterized protein n=1 Tax=Trichonephila clavipes TaxID=2585209 RepID=A0A8X6STM2_TRICX|nr:hypothetical protein TNCV_3385221 [Trichonephila clavipes]